MILAIDSIVDDEIKAYLNFTFSLMFLRPLSREASLGPSFVSVGSSVQRGEFPYALSPDVDASVPFPRTSGARFCGNFLVIFQVPKR